MHTNLSEYLEKDMCIFITCSKTAQQNSIGFQCLEKVLLGEARKSLTSIVECGKIKPRCDSEKARKLERVFILKKTSL